MQTAKDNAYTIHDFIREMGLTMHCVQVDHNPNMDDSADMDHWFCTIMTPEGAQEFEPEADPMYRLSEQFLSQAGDIDAREGRLTLVFSMGRGHNGKAPELADVLDCIASDAATIENADSFEDWASDLCYDEDSRRAERTYNACREQAERLRRFIVSTSDYETLLYETERL